jgi:hypothetical protein
MAPITTAKKGQIRLSLELFFLSDKKVLAALFSEFFPTNAEKNKQTQEIEYWGFCEQFRPIDAFDIVPFYTVSIEEKGGKMIVSFTEITK